MTNTTGGTNYDGEVQSDECCPMVINVSHIETTTSASHESPAAMKVVAPFIHQPQKWLPRVVLTKSHCKSDSTTFDDFSEGCYSVVFSSKVPGNQTSVPYSADVRVSRYVHLIRSPMDNLVARKHMAVRHSVKTGTLPKPLKAEVLMNDTAESFQVWCREFDKRHLPSMMYRRNHTHALYEWLAKASQPSGYIPIPWYVIQNSGLPSVRNRTL
jgi:hypothetical protein